MTVFEVSQGFQSSLGPTRVTIPPLALAEGEILILWGGGACRIDEVLSLLAGQRKRTVMERPPSGRIRSVAPTSVISDLPIAVRSQLLYSDDDVNVRSLCGYANCDPDLVMGRTVLEEYLLALASRSEQHARQIWAISELKRFDLADKAMQRVNRLSGGERQRLGIASAVAGEPPVVAIDLTANHLDVEFRDFVFSLVRSGVDAGKTFLLGLIDRSTIPDWMKARARVLHVIDDTDHLLCTLKSFGAHEQEIAGQLQTAPETVFSPSGRSLGGVILTVRNLTHRKRLVAPVSFVIRESELVCLTGPNGIGKTSVAEIVAGQVSAWEIDGDCIPEDGIAPALATQFPHQWILGQTANEELPDAGLLDCIGIGGEQALAPIDELSFAQRRLLSCASALYYSRGLAILDEPTAGLDSNGVRVLTRLVNNFDATAILFASHDPAIISRAREVRMPGGVP